MQLSEIAVAISASWEQTGGQRRVRRSVYLVLRL
jgi:hypothetical protein